MKEDPVLSKTLVAIAGLIASAVLAVQAPAQSAGPVLDTTRFTESLTMLPLVIQANIEGDFEAAETWVGIMASQSTRYSVVDGDSCEIVLHLTDPEQDIVLMELHCEVASDGGALASLSDEMIGLISAAGYELGGGSTSYYSRRDAAGIHSAIVRLSSASPTELGRLEIEFAFQPQTPPQAAPPAAATP